MSTGATEGRSWLRRVLPPVVAVFLLFAPQFAALESPRNRYFLFWGRADTLSLCVAVLLLAGAGIALGALIDRRGGPRLRGLKDQAFVALFLLGIAVNLPRAARAPFLLEALRPWRDVALVLLQAALALMLTAWAWLLVFRRGLLLRAARGAALVLSPLLPILVIQSFLYESDAVRPDALPPAVAAATSGADGTPIILIVFDEWSYERSVAGGDFLPDLPALRALRAESFFFTRAASPATTTYTSMPRLLFQTAEYRSLPGVICSWRDFPAEIRPPLEYITRDAAPGEGPRTLFAGPRQDGYLAHVLGFYLPYRRILGDQVDTVRTWSDYPRGDGVVSRIALNVAQTPQYWRLPGLSTWWKRAYAGVFSAHWLRLNERLLSDFEALLGATPRRSLIFLHFPVPHAPFIYDSDGAYRGPFPIHSGMSEDIDADVMRGTVEDYHRSLGHLDRVVARIVADLRASGRWDDALVIMTSDHAWRGDPALHYAPDNPRVMHVPLLVKVPRQGSPRTFDEPIPLNRIAPLVDAAARGGLDEDAAARILAAIAAAAAP